MESKGSVARGVAQVLLFNVAQIVIAVLTGYLGVAVISVSQLVYVIPAIIFARRKGHEDTLKGIIIGASLTVLLNIACVGYFLFALHR